MRHHRALADAEMTAHLWVRMVSDIQRQFGLSAVPHEFLRTLQKAPKAQMNSCAERAKHRLGL
jgi:DNA polymerase-3 subunit epsilon